MIPGSNFLPKFAYNLWWIIGYLVNFTCNVCVRTPIPPNLARSPLWVVAVIPPPPRNFWLHVYLESQVDCIRGHHQAFPDLGCLDIFSWTTHPIESKFGICCPQGEEKKAVDVQAVTGCFWYCRSGALTALSVFSPLKNVRIRLAGYCRHCALVGFAHHITNWRIPSPGFHLLTAPLKR